MGRGGRLQRLVTLLSKASETSGAGRAAFSDAAASRRYLSSGASKSLHACQAPIAAGDHNTDCLRSYSLDHNCGQRHKPALLVSSGSPIRELLRGVSAGSTTWSRQISAQALQPSDTYVHLYIQVHSSSFCVCLLYHVRPCRVVQQ